MVVGFICGIGIAYLLSLFNIDHMIIAGVKDLIHINIGTGGYYFMMGVVSGISTVMIGGFITGLFVAWLFTFIKLDHIVITGLREWFKYELSTGGYYLLFAIIGAAASFLKVVRTMLRPVLFVAGRKTR